MESLLEGLDQTTTQAVASEREIYQDQPITQDVGCQRPLIPDANEPPAQERDNRMALLDCLTEIRFFLFSAGEWWEI